MILEDLIVFTTDDILHGVLIESTYIYNLYLEFATPPTSNHT